jgi:hypothetical protein
MAHLAQSAFAHLTRPGALGEKLAPEARQKLEEVIFDQVRYLTNPEDGSALADFASVLCGLTVDLLNRHDRADLGRRSLRQERRHHIEEVAQKEIGWSRGPEDLMSRVLRRTLREERLSRRGRRSIPVKKEDPLFEIFGSDQPRGTRLPRQDMRVHLWRTLERTPSENLGEDNLLSALRLGAAFTPERMREALGEDLFSLCRPEGFADKQHTILFARVPSASAAQMVAMRKVEILDRLRPLPGLDGLRDLRTQVDRNFNS